ncbi:MAG: efflux RND transporter periplasmic adaptor subunit [Gemmatimonadetes bacterium]|nr:efflux RND transporter periplasmic adaptor subunit [Gemmatimonadota bacterium]MBI3567005.1 efflux RND transporter periplasmic adaptor subunit [Gemmatimonadota bacterium]
MSKGMKYGIGAVVILGIGAVVTTTAMKSSNKATEVRIEAVQKRDLVSSVTASGQVTPHTKADLSADISGRIVKLSVKEGDWVKAGQFLLQIDPQSYEAAVQRADAALSNAKASQAQAQANLVQAENTYRRSQEIRKSNPNLLAADQLEQLKTAVEVNTALLEAAKHNVEQAQASVRDAKVQLEKTTILAPMSGRVTRLVVENGETAIQGTFNKDAATLLTISDMSVLETKVKVDETDVSRIHIGDSTVVQLDAFPDTTFIGKVVEISNSSVKAAATTSTGDQAIDYEVTVQLLNPPKDTKPDFSATAKIVTDTRKQVLSIPIIALTVRENEALANSDTAQRPGSKQQNTKQVGKKDVEGVFVVGADNKVTFKPVKVGIAGEKHFEVLDGLKEGDKIVAGTYQAIRELKDGTLVREAKQADKKTGSPKP